MLTLIKNAQLVNEGRIYKADVLIKNKIINAVLNVIRSVVRVWTLSLSSLLATKWNSSVIVDVTYFLNYPCAPSMRKFTHIPTPSRIRASLLLLP